GDVRECRFAVTRTDRYAPYDRDALEEDDGLEEAVQRADWVNLLARARSALERCYVRSRPHSTASWACGVLGDDLGQRHHKECFIRLLKSIMDSGDGRTPETAFVVIGVWEEHDLLNAMELRRTWKTRLRLGDRWVDRLTVQSPTDSEPFDLYFDVTIPMTAMTPHNMTYEAILDLAKRNPKRVDFGEFRFAFTRTGRYVPYDLDVLEEDEGLKEAARRSDWVNVL